MDPEIAEEEQLNEIEEMIDGMIDDDSPPIVDSDDAREMFIDVIEDEEDYDDNGDYMYVDVDDGYDCYVFTDSINGVPTMYDSGSDVTFVFTDLDEIQVLSYVKTMIELLDSGVNVVDIVWAFLDQRPDLDEDMLDYMVAHAEEIWERGTRDGWDYGSI